MDEAMNSKKQKPMKGRKSRRRELEDISPERTESDLEKNYGKMFKVASAESSDEDSFGSFNPNLKRNNLDSEERNQNMNSVSNQFLNKNSITQKERKSMSSESESESSSESDFEKQYRYNKELNKVIME